MYRKRRVFKDSTGLESIIGKLKFEIGHLGDGELVSSAADVVEPINFRHNPIHKILLAKYENDKQKNTHKDAAVGGNG